MASAARTAWGGLIKCGVEAITGGIDLSTAEPVKLAANRRVMSLNKAPPVAVAESDGRVG